MPEPLILRLPTDEEGPEFLRAHLATSPDTPSFLHGYRDGMSLDDYRNALVDLRENRNLAPGVVPETFLFGFAGPRIVGRVAIRHALTVALERVGGHIGFVVVPEFRRRGYATRMLALSLRIAREQLGIDDVLLTCSDDNLGSIRVIERNGGVLDDIVVTGDPDEPHRRYWIRWNADVLIARR